VRQKRLSYQKSLDEFTESELKTERDDRFSARVSGLCDYRDRPGYTPFTMMTKRLKRLFDFIAR
jgi:hypothetical protein